VLSAGAVLVLVIRPLPALLPDVATSLYLSRNGGSMEARCPK
jgi:hypothetical protein